MPKLTSIFLPFIFIALSLQSADKTLKVLAAVEGYSQAPFFTWQKGDKEPSGFDPDLIRLIAKELKLKPIFFKLDLSKDWTDIRREVLEAEIVDLVAYAYSITEDRKKHVSFSLPYYETSMNALVLKGSQVNSIKDLNKVPVLAFGHTTGYQWAIKNLQGKIIKDFPIGFRGSINDLLKEKTVGAFLGDLENLESMALADSELEVMKEPLQKEELGIAVNKKNKELLKKIDKALLKLKANGELEKLRKKYFDQAAIIKKKKEQ